MYPSTNYDYTPDDMIPNMYPPDEHIPMLNGFVRRMPTIESLGSYALSSVGGGAGGNSSRAASRAGTLVSVSASTRPPTSMGAYPPSRGNSLHLSEMGYRLQQLGGAGGGSGAGQDDGTVSTTTTNDSSVATRSNTVSSYNTAASFASGNGTGTGSGTGSMPSPVESSSTNP